MYTLKPESLLNAFTCNNTKQWLVLSEMTEDEESPEKTNHKTCSYS